MQETQVWFLGWEDPLEKEMATTTVFLPGESHGQRNLAGYSPWGHKSQTRLSDLTTSNRNLDFFKIRNVPIKKKISVWAKKQTNPKLVQATVS